MLVAHVLAHEIPSHLGATIPTMPQRPYRATVRYDHVFTHLAQRGRTLCGQIVDDRTFGPEELQRTCPSCVMAESMTHFGGS